MARASNMESLEQQIRTIDEKIGKSMKYIAELKTKRQELLNKKEAISMQEITQILQEKNLNAEQAAEILRNYNAN